MLSRWLTLGGLLAVLATAGLFWGTDWPLGVPIEWTWARVPLAAGQPSEWLFGLLIAVCAALVYCAFAGRGARRIAHSGPGKTAAWLIALVTAGFFLVSALQNAAPEPYGLSKAVWVLYYPRSSGYFFESRYRLPDVKTFLAEYEQRVASGRDYLHLGTHPPGLILFHRGLSVLCRRYPALADSIVASQPKSVRLALDTIAANEALGPTPLLPGDRASLWFSALVTQLVAVATIIPFYLLLRVFGSKRASWMTAAFWPLVPALVVFVPKSDVLYPFFAAAFAWLWLSSYVRRSLLRALLAGGVLWGGMLFSLTMLPVALYGTVAVFWVWWSDRVQQHCDPAHAKPGCRYLCEPSQRLVLSLVGVFATFALATLVFGLAFDINLPAVWIANLRNHAQFYEHFTRTYWKWLLVNPLELVFAAGLPVALLAAAGCGTALRRFPRERLAAMAAFAVVFAALWLSGKNMGEAARLWLFLQPAVLWLAAPCFEPAAAGPAAPAAQQRELANEASPLPTAALIGPAGWLTFLALQCLAALATAARIDGFHLSEL